jgi:hypothetical protein
MPRPITEIQADISRVEASIGALPIAAIRLGYADEYEGELDALKDELKEAQEIEDSPVD